MLLHNVHTNASLSIKEFCVGVWCFSLKHSPSIFTVKMSLSNSSYQSFLLLVVVCLLLLICSFFHGEASPDWSQTCAGGAPPLDHSERQPIRRILPAIQGSGTWLQK